MTAANLTTPDNQWKLIRKHFVVCLIAHSSILIYNNLTIWKRTSCKSLLLGSAVYSFYWMFQNTPEEVQREKKQTETSVKWINCDAEQELRSSFFKTEMTLTNTPAFDAVRCANISSLIDNLIDIFSIHFYDTHTHRAGFNNTVLLFTCLNWSNVIIPKALAILPLWR